MKLVKKTLKRLMPSMEELTPSTSKHCDKCGNEIKENEKAIGFHGEEHESFLCEACITVIYNEYIEELDD